MNYFRQFLISTLEGFQDTNNFDEKKTKTFTKKSD